jgi:hypothetical protein
MVSRKTRFYFVTSLVFWVLMVIGFSDNWLFDVGQESNSDPKFLIHAFFAFAWFSLLVVQTGLIQANRKMAHMTTGIAAITAYAGFFLATSYIYIGRAISEGVPEPLALLNLSLLLFGSILIVRGFSLRKKDAARHKMNIVFGTFMLMEPGISRSIGHLFETGAPMWLLTYLVLFGAFVWHSRRVIWQIAVGFSIWLIGTANIIINMAPAS